MKKIMVDMDDVIVSGGFLYLINEFLHTNYTEDDVKGYYMQDLVPNKQEFYEFFLTKNMYDCSYLNNTVVEVLERLSKYYDIYIGTSFIFKEIVDKSGILLLHKYEFLCRNFPFLDPYKFVFLGEKSILKCDIKIDDKLDNLNNCDTKILYTAYHNKNIKEEELEKLNAVRANNWDEVEKILMENYE